MKLHISKTLMLAAALLATAPMSARDFSGLSPRQAQQVAPVQAPSLSADDEPEATWRSVGTGKFTDDFLASLFDTDRYTYDVEIEERVGTPGLFRVKNPYEFFASAGVYDSSTDHYLIVHAEDPAHVYLETCYTGFTPTAEYGELIISSKAWKEMEGGSSQEEIEMLGLYGKMEDGAITFPHNTLLAGLQKLGGFYNANYYDSFRLALPTAKDYSVTITQTSLCAIDNQVTFIVEFGGNVAQAKFLLVPGDLDFSEDNYRRAFAEGGNIPRPNYYSLTLRDGEGRYTLLIASGDDKGNYKSGEGVYFYNHPDNASQWRSLGMGMYGEDIIASLYNAVAVSEFPVEVEENIATRGFYRLKNPYNTPEFKYSTASTHDTDHNHYIFIHAENPDEVYIEDSMVGMSFDYGSVCINSYANYDPMLYWTPQYLGTLADGRITFPQNALMIAESADQHGRWYPANRSGAFYVTIPGLGGIDAVAADSNDAPVHLYNLQGVEVNPESAPDGIYIRRCGEKARKVMIRR